MLNYQKTFEVKAMRTAVDMINLSPASALDGDISNKSLDRKIGALQDDWEIKKLSVLPQI